jgi:hypothetical protein
MHLHGVVDYLIKHRGNVSFTLVKCTPHHRMHHIKHTRVISVVYYAKVKISLRDEPFRKISYNLN